MTMHIDDALLKRVMDTYGLETKTDAVEYALKELDRKARLRKFMKEGLGLTAAELKDAVYPGYAADRPTPSSRVAEESPPYGAPRPD
ncbi:type II toxin-antitoxin system VapB family antitoxin [Luteolibacter sp. Populi]|uniref:type II toxin-antitoxin system VapB family antitoxin n=1 Tax=Luteolibacter sp. Populi TaxID=3230487 RepID=UPI003466E423